MTAANVSAQGRLLQIMTAISIEKDLDRLLSMILTTARELTDAESGRIYILDPSGRRLIRQVVQNDGADESLSAAEPIELYRQGRPNNRNVVSYCAFSGEPVRVDDVPTSGAFNFSSRLKYDQKLGCYTQSLLVAPLNRPDEFTVGVLELCNALDANTRDRIAFRQEQEELVHAFASQAAASINNARLLEENRRLIAVLNESNRDLEQENRKLKSRVYGRCDFSAIIGDSKAMQHVFELVEKITTVDTTVLVLGETGVGKELIAQALHTNGKRKDGAFIAQNCAALPENLLESELFGYRKGAFTGADRDKPGLFEAAHKGTLFLDEIGDLPLALQAKLLRVLQEGEFRPLGSVETRRVDVRLLTATHQNLEKSVEAGKFRQDLFYRLQVFPIVVPPLRERLEDVPALIQHFIKGFSAAHGKRIAGITPKALECLLRHDFPGNVRELRNIVERAVILAEEGGSVGENELPAQLAAAAGPSAGDLTNGLFSVQQLKPAVEQYEAEFIQRRLNARAWNVTRTAEDLAISRRSLQLKMARYGIRASK